MYAYDELQSLDEKTLPSPEELFGISLTNEPGKPKADIILEKCYRNPRQILTAAHAIGFGIYTEGQDLVQMFDDQSLWLDIGYEVTDGELRDGTHVVLERTNESSPKFLETHSTSEDIVQFLTFNSQHEQDAWVAAEIEKNIRNEDLRPEDIVVINPNAINTRDAIGEIRESLLNNGIDSTFVGVSSSRDIFSTEGKVSFSGIHRAKGNEAGMIYIINADYCYKGWGLAKRRNTLFTAMTRAKAWVRVLGVGSNMQGLTDEFNRLKNSDFKLSFTYPTEAERRKMRTINRDLSSDEKKKLREKERHLKESIKALESGQLTLDGIPEETKDALRKLLKK